jgi:hypothetical protein
MSPARPARQRPASGGHLVRHPEPIVSTGAGATAPPAAPEPDPEPEPVAPSRPGPPAQRAEGPALAGKRVPIRVQVPEELADRVRAAVAALAYQEDAWSSLNSATAAALEKLVAEAEAEHNDGQPFPWRPGRQLQPGRRVGH